MNSKEDIRSISYVKSHAADIVLQVNETQRPVYVTQNGEAKAVLLDPQSYEKMKKALGLLKLAAQGERDLREGKIVEQAQLFQAMDEKVEKL